MDILSIIPQRPPFVMVDHLVSCNADGSTRTLFEVKADNVLVNNNKLTEAGLVENIAQTAAAGSGYAAKYGGKAVSTGYIAAIKNLEIYALPQVGDVIETLITVTNKIFEMTIISGIIECKGTVLAKCEMKIFVKN